MTDNKTVATATSNSTGVRHVLLLQGPSSFFFQCLGSALKSRGARVTRVCFAPGDWLYWSRHSGQAVRFADKAERYLAWIADFVLRNGVSDIVMLGDGRFYHREAIRAVRDMEHPPNIHIIEHGLLRPGWLLVEPDGLGAASSIKTAFADAPPAGVVQPSSARGAGFLRYAVLDVVYHAAGIVAGRIYNPNYVRHSLDSPMCEYAGWLWKFFRRPSSCYRDRIERRKLDGDGPVFLFPLQLETDFQIRHHGGGIGLREHLSRVMTSFRDHAPSDARIVIKRHPLDNGLRQWRVIVDDHARKLGIRDRVVYLDRGDLELILARASGVVTVNSTVGLQAVVGGTPCLVLGEAVYDLPGLTAQCPLEDFWRSPLPPDRQTAQDFRAFVLSEYHVEGSFDGPGARIGAANLAGRICG